MAPATGKRRPVKAREASAPRSKAKPDSSEVAASSAKPPKPVKRSGAKAAIDEAAKVESKPALPKKRLKLEPVPEPPSEDNEALFEEMFEARFAAKTPFPGGGVYCTSGCFQLSVGLRASGADPKIRRGFENPKPSRTIRLLGRVV
jgi:hypothetical protein